MHPTNWNSFESLQEAGLQKYATSFYTTHFDMMLNYFHVGFSPITSLVTRSTVVCLKLLS